MGHVCALGLGGGLTKEDNSADDKAEAENFQPVEGFSEIEYTDSRDESGSSSRPDGIDGADFEIFQGEGHQDKGS